MGPSPYFAAFSEQIDERLFDQNGVERYERQILRKIDVKLSLRAGFPDDSARHPPPLRATATPVHFHRARFEPRHVEQIADQAIQSLCFLSIVFVKSRRVASSIERPPSTSVLAVPVMTASGTQVV